LLAGEEAELEPAKDVVHDRLGVAKLGVLRPAAGLEARVRELLAERLQGHAVLQRERDGGGEAVHESGDRGALLGHLDEGLAGRDVLVEADGDVAFVAGDRELVRDAGTLVAETVTDRAGRAVE